MKKVILAFWKISDKGFLVMERYYKEQLLNFLGKEPKKIDRTNKS